MPAKGRMLRRSSNSIRISPRVGQSKLRALARKHTFHIACPLHASCRSPLFVCTRRMISRVLLRITVALAWVLVCTDTVAARCVCAHKSDLITLDDSSANIRALTSDAQTFIAFGVAAAGGRGGKSHRAGYWNDRISP